MLNYAGCLISSGMSSAQHIMQEVSSSIGMDSSEEMMAPIRDQQGWAGITRPARLRKKSYVSSMIPLGPTYLLALSK